MYSLDFSVAPGGALGAAAVPGRMPRKLSPSGLMLVIAAVLSVLTGTRGIHGKINFHACGILGIAGNFLDAPYRRASGIAHFVPGAKPPAFLK